ncbi:helix-turn-helix domain-containing protein [Chloroflexota bacterium]
MREYGLDTVSAGAYLIAMYSVKEAAEKLRISEQHLRYLLANGDIEGKKISRDWVVLSLDYKRKRRPKRNSKPELIVQPLEEKAKEKEKADSIERVKKPADTAKFELHQLVKVITQDTPYRNLSGRVVEIAKQQFSHRYWIEFSWPPQGYSKLKEFMEEQLVSTDDFFLMRGA